MATKKLDLRLPQDMRDELDRIAHEEQQKTGKTVAAADVARAAIADWLHRGKIKLPDKPMVDRGGNRRQFDTEPTSA